MTKLSTHALQISLVSASALLALAPLEWLITSWRDPAYQSHGHFYAIALVAIIVLSFLSGAPNGDRPSRNMLFLFMFAAVIRLTGQVLAINILGALALAVDVFAIALLLQVNRRPLALSPFWLASFFVFAMPLAPILERLLGFPLQRASADLACQILGWFYRDLQCNGVRLQINEVDVLVDLPCSGASGLLLLLSLWAFLNILYRPPLVSAFFGCLAVLAAALISNALRISLLAAGLAENIDTMTPWLHSLIGFAMLLIAALPIIAWYRPQAAKHRFSLPALPSLPTALKLPTAIAALVLSVFIIQAPRTPLDQSRPITQQRLPAQLLGEPGNAVALSNVEEHYFTAYGGKAQKAQYGPLGLNVVKTTSPLRHLHAPETCLRGMGYTVRFLGTKFDPIPTSIYEATGPDGVKWHVAVSYVSSDGARSASVGEAVWHWLAGRSQEWRSVQRITPLSLAANQRIDFERAALAALDLS